MTAATASVVGGEERVDVQGQEGQGERVPRLGEASNDGIKQVAAVRRLRLRLGVSEESGERGSRRKRRRRGSRAKRAALGGAQPGTAASIPLICTLSEAEQVSSEEEEK